ncbi:MAG: hypothetical protein ACREBA_07795 [Nitrosotalea sp.]
MLESKNSIQYVCFFDNMRLDLARKLPDLWNDVYDTARKNGYLADIEFNVISLYEEQNSKLFVIKMMVGRDMHVKKVTRLVFEKPQATPVKQYEMIGIDGILPIWKEI